jgi:hypothetical protein
LLVQQPFRDLLIYFAIFDYIQIYTFSILDLYSIMELYNSKIHSVEVMRQRGPWKTWKALGLDVLPSTAALSDLSLPFLSLLCPSSVTRSCSRRIVVTGLSAFQGFIQIILKIILFSSFYTHSFACF